MDRRRVSTAPIAAAIGILILTMGGCGSGEDAPAAVNSPQSKAAIAQYRSYLEESAAVLVGWTEKINAQIKTGNLREAPSSYSSSRVPYGQLEPAAESLFAGLASRIDAHSGDVPASEFGGFHRIEEGLWEGEGASLEPVAKQLLADVRELQRRLKTAEMTTAQILDGASGVLDEAAATAVHGGEEPNYLIDLVDVGANVEAIEAAFEAVKPPLEEADPELSAKIASDLKGAYQKLRTFGRVARRPDQTRPEAPGTTFVRYGERTQAEYDQLGQKIDALVEDFSDASEALLGP